MKYDILVNKIHPLNKDYIPDNLVEVTEYSGPKIDSSFKTLVEKTVYEAFYEMQEIALKEGYHLIIDSAYRPYEYQEIILNHNLSLLGEKAYETVALPGTSEHQTGLAIDIALIINGNYVDEFDDTFPQIQWLHQNAHLFGFILRYPKNKTQVTGYKYECWHIRYVGKEIALYMNENQIETFEEYYQLNKSRTLE